MDFCFKLFDAAKILNELPEENDVYQLSLMRDMIFIISYVFSL